MSLKSIYVVLMVLVACTAKENCEVDLDQAFFLPENQVRELPSINKNPGYFNSCEEIKNETLENFKVFKALQPTYSASSKQCNTEIFNAETSPVNNVNQPTNTQEKTVDEADLVKVSREFIFYAKRGRIEVLKRNSLEFLKSLSFYVHETPKIYVGEETLIVIHGYFSDATTRLSSATYTPPPQQIQVSFYDLNADFKLIKNLIVDGRYQESRFDNKGDLTIVTSTPLTSHDLITSEQTMNQSLMDKDCKKIKRPFVRDSDFTLTNIFQLKMNDKKLSQHSVHLYGSYNDVYMSKDLFLSKVSNSWFDNKQIYYPHTSQQIIVGLSKIKEQWEQETVGVINGRTIGSWSYKQKEDYLFVTTGLIYTKQNLSMTNALYTLKKEDGELIIVDSVTGFAPNEELKSVRYFDDFAYIVTFEEFDPLFIFNIHQPENILPMGELTVPGFSTYLHPVGDQQLLGIGTNNFNLQLSLFDVKNPALPTALTQINFTDSQDSYSSSIAQSDHHAFHFDPHFKRIAIPFKQYKYVLNQWQKELGAYFFKIEADHLKLETAISHDEWFSKVCTKQLNVNYDSSSFNNINRILKIDDRLLSFSDFGVMQHSQKEPQKIIRKTEFMDVQDSCPKPYPICNIIY